MQSNIKQMQGTSAFIETHYEAMAYWRQEKKVCHYKVYWECTNPKSAQCNKECIGYTKCSDFISDERYNQKQVNLYKAKMKQKSNFNKQNPKLSDNAVVTNKKKVKSAAPKHKQRKISENALGNDPRFKKIFEQFR